MPFKEISSKTIKVSLPSGETLATISCSEEAKMITIQLNQPLIIKRNKALGIRSSGLYLEPIYARFLGEGLARAADIADQAWGPAGEPPASS